MEMIALWTNQRAAFRVLISRRSESAFDSRVGRGASASPTLPGAHSCTHDRLRTRSSSRLSLRTEEMAAMTVSMTGVRASATPSTRRARIGSRQVAPSAFRRGAVTSGRRSNALVVGSRPLIWHDPCGDANPGGSGVSSPSTRPAYPSIVPTIGTVVNISRPSIPRSR